MIQIRPSPLLIRLDQLLNNRSSRKLLCILKKTLFVDEWIFKSISISWLFEKHFLSQCHEWPLRCSLEIRAMFCSLSEHLPPTHPRADQGSSRRSNCYTGYPERIIDILTYQSSRKSLVLPRDINEIRS